MTLVNGKSQCIITGRLAGYATQAAVPRLKAGRVEGCGTDTGLQEYLIHTSLLQLVKNRAQFSLLFLNRTGRLSIAVWPVDAANGGEPHGPYLMFRRCWAPRCVGYSHFAARHAAYDTKRKKYLSY